MPSADPSSWDGCPMDGFEDSRLPPFQTRLMPRKSAATPKPSNQLDESRREAVDEQTRSPGDWYMLPAIIDRGGDYKPAFS